MRTHIRTQEHRRWQLEKQLAILSCRPMSPAIRRRIACLRAEHRAVAAELQRLYETL